MVIPVPTEFEVMDCRVCHAPIEPDLKRIEHLRRRITVNSREDCIYHCSCGVSYSNARNERDRVMILASPEQNVPREVREGLAETLERLPDHRHRKAKKMRFCFETSEDAVTWTVFRGLERQGRLDALVAPDCPAGEPALLLWGVPVADSRAEETADALGKVCRMLGELPGSLSEPDVIVRWDDLLVLVEAKYRGGNECRPGHPGFRHYLDRSDLFEVSAAEVGAAGYYELTRSWRIGSELAEALSVPAFLLVNLGPPEKIESDAEAFSGLVAVSEKRDFVQRSWNDVLEAASPLEPWLDRYASERHRLLYWR
jgi:hypothetical protein